MNSWGSRRAVRGLPVGPSREDDFPVVVAQDGGVGEGDAEDVACEIGQRLVAGADRLGVDHPGLAPDGIRHGGKEVGVCFAQEVAEAGGEQDRKGADGNKELRACLAPGAVGSEASTGGQDMNVRMVDQLSRPGVKDGGERGQAAEVAGIAAEVEQGRDGGLEEERQDLAGMGTYGAAQFLGHGEGDQVIGDARQQQASLTFVPEFGVGLSAGRAVPVAAGPVGEDGVATPRAVPADAAQGCRVTGFQRAHGAELFRGHARAEALSVGRAVGAEDRADARHQARSPIRRPTCCAALLVACSVRWV